MRTIQRIYLAVLFLLVQFNALSALAYDIAVSTNEVAIGEPFTVSWTSETTDPLDVDICLSTDSEFIPVGSIERSDADDVAGSVDVTLSADTIAPGTYEIGIRFTGCSFLLASTFEPFIVDPASS